MNHKTSIKYIALRLPNWLGDGVMASICFELLKKEYQNAKFILIGTTPTCEIYKRDKRVEAIYIDKSKDALCRFYATYKLGKNIAKSYKIDIAITFTNHFYSALLLYFLHPNISIGFDKITRRILLDICVKRERLSHQALTYTLLLSPLDIQASTQDKTHLIAKNKSLILKSKQIQIGINPGAAYGSAKRWKMNGFIELVGFLLDRNYLVYIFGVGKEGEANSQILTALATHKNYKNLKDLSNKTSIESLVDSISMLDLFISNDSGPMHIADALDIPLVAIFGPTDDKDTRPFNFTNTILINKHLPCAPCKKRVCPLKHHNCMEQISSSMVLESAIKLLQKETP